MKITVALFVTVALCACIATGSNIPTCGKGHRLVSVYSSGDGYTGELRCIRGAQYSTRPRGTQEYEGHTNEATEKDCIANPEAPGQLVELALESAFSMKNRQGYHDLLHRTGRDSIQSIHIKSIPFNELIKKKLGRAECKLHGYAHCNGHSCRFVEVTEEDPDYNEYPNIVISRGDVSNKKFGPSHFPNPSSSGISDDICSGDMCCVTSSHYDGPEHWYQGPAKIAKSLHFLCNVRFMRTYEGEKCEGKDRRGKELIACGHRSFIPWNWSRNRQLGCNCLELSKKDTENAAWDFMKFQGFGLDCSDILPGGAHANKGWDVYQMHSWALNKAYKEIGTCDFRYVNEQIREYRRCYKSWCRIPRLNNVNIAFGHNWKSDNGVSHPSLFWWGGHW
eukprot:Nk52_evm14s2273 gene=Nk52_evmTU14s2273